MGALCPGWAQGAMDAGVKACTFSPGLQRDVGLGKSSQMLQAKQSLVSRALGVRSKSGSYCLLYKNKPFMADFLGSGLKYVKF